MSAHSKNPTQEPAGDRERIEQKERGKKRAASPREDDLFYFADKAAGFLLVFGLGYLVLRNVPSALWFGIALVAVGGVMKIALRLL